MVDFQYWHSSDLSAQDNVRGYERRSPSLTPKRTFGLIRFPRAVVQDFSRRPVAKCYALGI
jgi:hypothetical protein